MAGVDSCVTPPTNGAGSPVCGPPDPVNKYHVGYKAKVHRAVPEAAYVARFEIEDDEPFTGELHYRVRIEQRNGQRAWSSPVWVGPPERL